MQKKILVHCNTSNSAIHSKASTRFFTTFLWQFWDISDSDRKQIVKIFQKLKQGSAISEDEYSFFSMFLSHKDIEDYLELSKQECLQIQKWKWESVSFSSLQTELLTRLTNSRAIWVLQQEQYRTRVIEIDGKEYVGIIEKSKKIYFQILEDFEWYYVCKNLRSGKRVVIFQKTFEICYSDMGHIECKTWPFEGTIFIQKGNSTGGIMVHSGGSIALPGKDVRYYEDRFFYYIIDNTTQNVHRIDKKTFAVEAEGISEFICKALNGKYIVGEFKKGRGGYMLYELTGTIKQIMPVDDYILEDDGSIILYEAGEKSHIIQDGVLSEA